MFGNLERDKTQRIGFLLIPNFSMIAFTAAIEPLRTANRLANKKLYDWKIIGTSSESILASNELEILPELNDNLNLHVINSFFRKLFRIEDKVIDAKT